MDRKIRTLQQNAMLHGIFREIANECNVMGLDQKVVVEKFYQEGFPVNADWVKETLFREVMKKLYNVDSTTKLSTTQFSEMLEMFLLAIKMRLGIHIHLPDEIPLDAYDDT